MNKKICNHQSYQSCLRGDECAQCLRERAAAAEARVGALEASILKHRDQRGDDRCWLDDLELYKLVGGTADNSLPPKEKFLANCARFYEARCHNANWPSYQELQAQIVTLKSEVASLTRPIG